MENKIIKLLPNSTFLNIKNNIDKVQDLLKDIQIEKNNWRYGECVAALELSEENWIGKTEALTQILIDREYPMSYEDIKSVFVFSGFDFNESDILKCNPDSEEKIKEEEAYYRE